MDLNQLYFQQQLSAMRACAANDHADQAKHQALGDEIEGSVERFPRYRRPWP